MKKIWPVLAAVIMVVFASTLCLAETGAGSKAEAKQTTPAGKVNLNSATQAADPAKNPAASQAGSAAKTAKPAAPPPVGKNMVWVNINSKIFHKSGSKWYGKTKHGSYMSVSEAIKAGYREAK